MIGTLNSIKKNVYNKLHTDDMLENYLYLSNVLNEKDDYIVGHCERVAYYCSLIGKNIDLSPKEMELLVIGAYFHDFGKIAIPREVLNKSGSLSDNEWKIVQLHPVKSAKLLQTAGCPEDAVLAMLHHHENYDGTGYPDGLAGDEIPLLSRIVAVADSYDAMTSKRSYSDEIKKEEALSNIYLGRGIRYDPDIVDAFFDIVQLSYMQLQAV